MSDPASRLHGLAARAELAAVARGAVARAEEAVDAAETRGDRKGTLAALTTLTRTLASAERLHPAADEWLGDVEVRALLLVLADELTDPAARQVITSGLRDRGAEQMADALTEVWATRPAVINQRGRQEIGS